MPRFVFLFSIAISCLLSVNMLFAASLSGVVVDGKGKPLSDVAIWAESPAAKAPRGMHVVMDQRHHMFMPRVMVINVGTRVDFPNNEDIFHNIFSYYKGKRFDLGLYPPKTTKSVFFDKVGVHELFCNIHSNMHAYIIVVDTPHHAVTSKKGKFAIEGLPSGEITLRIWREGKEQTRKTTLPPGGESHAVIELK